MNKKTKQNSFRPTLENLETREMMSVSPFPITQNNPNPITPNNPNNTVVKGGYNDAGDIKEAIAKDKDNTMDEAINLGNLLEGRVVKKQGVISFGAMPKTPDQPSWGQYCGLNSRDVDLYKFTVKAGDRVTFKFNTTVESTIWKEYVNGKLINVEKKYGLGLRAHLSDSTGNSLQLIADDGGFPTKLHGEVEETSILEHTFNKAGTYYLGISNYWHADYNIINGQEGSRNNLNSAIGPYSLSVSVKKDLPEFEAVNLRFDDSRTSLIFDYKMNQGDYFRHRPKDWKHNIGLYWTDTNGKVFGEIKNQRIDGFNNNTGFGSISQEITFKISLKDLGNPPNDLATHIRFVVNSGNKIPELNVSNNFKDLLLGTNYVVLFNGGKTWEVNDTPFVNDIKKLYEGFVSKYGVSKDNIFIVQSDGTSWGVDSSWGQSGLGFKGVAQNTDMSYAKNVYSATKDNLNTVFIKIKSKINQFDNFVFYSNSMGSDNDKRNSVDNSIGNRFNTGTESLWGWNVNKAILDIRTKNGTLEKIPGPWLADNLAAIKSRSASYIIGNCFGGGILDLINKATRKIDALPGATPTNRFGMAATNHYEYAMNHIDYNIWNASDWDLGFAKGIVQGLVSNGPSINISTFKLFNMGCQTLGDNLDRTIYEDNYGSFVEDPNYPDFIRNKYQHPWKFGRDFQIVINEKITPI